MASIDELDEFFDNEGLETLRTENKELKNELNKNLDDCLLIYDENDENDELNAQLREICEQFKESLATLRSLNGELKDELDKNPDDCLVIYNENEELDAQFKEICEQFEESLTTLRAVNKELKDELNKNPDDCLVTYNENDELKAQLKEISVKYKQSETTLCTKFKDELDKTSDEYLLIYNENDKFKNQIKEISEKCKQSEESLTTLRDELVECSKNSDNYLVMQVELKGQIKEISEKYKQSEESLITLRVENKKLRDELDECSKNSNNHLVMQNELEAQLKEIFEKYTTLCTENKKLKDELDKKLDICNDNDKLKAQIKEISEKYEESLTTLCAKFKDELNKSSDEYHNDNDKLKVQIKEFTEKCKQSEEILASLCIENKDLNDKLHKESKKYDQLSFDFKVKNGEVNKFQKKYYEAMSQNEGLEQDLTRYKAKNESISNKLLRKDSEIQGLQYKNEECIKIIKDLNNLLQKKGKQELVKANNTNLKTESSQYHGSDDMNHSAQLNNYISALQDMLKNYTTSLEEINFNAVKDLLKRYNINAKISSNKPNEPLIKAVLQYHILNSIMEGAKKFFEKNKNSESVLHLEANIASKSEELVDMLAYFSDTRTGMDTITQTASIKIRQEVSVVLSNRGFSDILDGNNVSKEHYFIKFYKDFLNEEMNKYRTIKDTTKKQTIEKIAPNLIREFVRIIQFRLNIQEPSTQMKWIPMNSKVDPSIMEGSWDENDIDNLIVEVCSFPMIGQDLDNVKKRKIYAHAQVFTKREHGYELQKTSMLERFVMVSK